MLSVFIVSALVHEYALTLGLGFFYPVMFVLFAVIGGEHRMMWGGGGCNGSLQYLELPFSHPCC